MILPVVFSCAGNKNVLKDKSTIKQKGTIYREVPGDSVIVIRDTIYRDTVIVHRTKFLNLVESYNKNGVVKIKCEQREVKEKEIYEREEKKNIKEMEKVAQGFKDVYFLYIGLILVVLVIVNKLLK